ncbi:MAG: HNH endonuclease [Fimbriimonadaceae bacterium]
MLKSNFDWNQFHAYRVFDEFLDRFILQRKSYVTSHPDQLDLAAVFDEIEKRFVVGYDDTDSRFEDKLANQFDGASEESKIVFANVEYLWAMPMMNIKPWTKRDYALRWFSSNEVVDGNSFFFGYPDTIANPGSWYLRNKYWELIAALRVLSLVASDPDLKDVSDLKERIAQICHQAIYVGIPPEERFASSRVCGIHSALMHLADPERYESIISASHRWQICSVFKHVVEDASEDREVLLKQIRSTLYESHGSGDDSHFRYRWFFYLKDVKPLWIDKKNKKEQRFGAAAFDVRNEENAAELEGAREEFSGYRILRSAKLVKAAKKRDRYTCRACRFHFENQIVHVHHLDPICEYESPRETKIEDLVTLCPTCHYLAHYWLRINREFTKLEPLLARLQTD